MTWRVMFMSGVWIGMHQTYYSSSPNRNPLNQISGHPVGVSVGDYRLLRGGSWRYDKKHLRLSHRHFNSPPSFSGYQGCGFRCVISGSN